MELWRPVKITAPVYFSGFTIQNGNSEKGAGIRNGLEPTEGYGNVNLKDMIFTNNYSSTTGSAIYYYTTYLRLTFLEVQT